MYINFCKGQSCPNCEPHLLSSADINILRQTSHDTAYCIIVQYIRSIHVRFNREPHLGPIAIYS